MPRRPLTRRQRRAMIIAGCILITIVAVTLAPIEPDEIWQLGATISQHPVAIAGVILLMAATMTLGLPGSLCFWLIAPFQTTPVAVAMLVTGSVAGALGAYMLSYRLSETMETGKLGRKVIRLLERRSDFLTQSALRILPGFPHALVNFGSGILRLPLPGFLIAAVVGLSIKWSVYAAAVQGTVSAAQAERALDFWTLMPLILMAGLLIAGGVVRRSLDRKLATPDSR